MSRSHELDSRTPSSVKNEVDRLIREGKYQLSPAEAVKLKEKFKDGAMFELVMEHLNESHVKILNVAKKSNNGFDNFPNLIFIYFVGFSAL